MTDTNKLGKRVSKYREQLGLTQEQLAVNAGLDLAYLQDVESGAIYALKRLQLSMTAWMRIIPIS